MEGSDHQLAQAIIDGASITLPNGMFEKVFSRHNAQAHYFKSISSIIVVMGFGLGHFWAVGVESG